MAFMSVMNSDDEKAKEELINSLGAYGNNLGDRALYATANLLVDTITTPFEVYDIAKQGWADLTYEKALKELDTQLANDEISQDTYNLELHRIDNYKQENDIRNLPEDSITRQLWDTANALQQETYFGANDIEKFVLQAGSSTGQFLLHYALFGMGAQAVTGVTSTALPSLSMSIGSGADKTIQLLNGIKTNM